MELHNFIYTHRCIVIVGFMFDKIFLFHINFSIGFNGIELRRFLSLIFTVSVNVSSTVAPSWGEDN